ncbi:hypothetical protein L486_07699 [Kwoniella mangroviensis CBS 10435]|uniref:Uncharacterized protein n=1 Tax=Kwoniella mangroviensis CBS 10435 TaxID=1331196 RepID=A0A1B9IGM7_9TREE|nr:uncharacterized protein I203_05707 [Kwoniella mangroviensis CBS 8507]OCF54567.1 hypothetical protein L486_07699 [Kwoniella mangroviensis CBS 10435]OCF64965.1 hypothetical protein I203_05707 [Kwoniella mangroviensis CBS 8507]OCF78808.1 hypothetical protein I204_00752 [Kwoniella mangroviensis CBS 8886]
MSSAGQSQYTEGDVSNGWQLQGGRWVPYEAPVVDAASPSAGILAIASRAPSQVASPGGSQGDQTRSSRGHSRSTSGASAVELNRRFARPMMWDSERYPNGTYLITIDYEAEHTGNDEESQLRLYVNDPRNSSHRDTWLQQSETYGGWDQSTNRRMDLTQAVETQLQPMYEDFVDRIVDSARTALNSFYNLRQRGEI